MADSQVVGILRALLTADTAQFESGMKRASNQFKALEKDWKKIGSQATILGAQLTKTLTLPLLGVGAAMLKVGLDFDKASDTIRESTGATGRDLKALEASLKNVFGTIPGTMEDVATAIADIHVRTGLTGPALERLTTQMLNLANVEKEEIGGLVASTTRAFGDWSIATDKQSTALDFLFKTSQSTGIGVTRLTDLVVQFGAPLRALGFDFESSAALMGKFEKEGVNLETVMSGLRFALGNFAKAGKEPAQALREVQAAILGAKTEAEATGIAFQVFGKRAAIDMSRAIIEGRFNIDELIEALRKSKETINGAAESTRGLNERFVMLGQRAMTAAEPLASLLVKALESVLNFIKPLIAHLGTFAQYLAGLPEPIQKVALGLGLVAASAGPLILVFGQLALSASAVAGAFTAQGLAARTLTAILPPLAAAARVAWAAILTPAGAIVGTIALLHALAKAWGAAIPPEEKRKELEQWGKVLPFMRDAAKQATPAIDGLTKSVQPLAAPVTAAAVATDKLKKAVADVVKPSKEAAAAAKKLAEAYAALMSEARNAQGLAQRAADFDVLNASISDATKSLRELAIQMRVPLPFIPNLAQNVMGVNALTEGLMQGVPKIASQSATAGMAIQGMGSTINQTIRNLAHAFEDLANIAQDSFGRIVKEIGTFLATLVIAEEAGQSFRRGWDEWRREGGDEGEEGDDRNRSQAFADMAAGALAAAAAMDQATASGSRLKRVGAGAATGAKIGAAAGPWGALVGAGVGALIGLFRGQSQGEKVNDMRDAFIAAAGGLEVLNERAVTAGTNLDALLRAKKVKDFEAAVSDLNAKMGEFADEQAADSARLDAAIQKYGFSFEQLGPQLQAQGLNDQAKELIEDWRVLAAAGVDVAEVNAHMSKTVSDYLQTALNVGAEIPAAMRPILQSMIDQGVLVDANGQAIQDLEATGITFAESMTAGFDRVVQKLQLLIDTLNGTGQAIANIPTNVDVNVNRRYHDLPDTSQPGRTIDIPAFATEGRVTRPMLALIGDAPEPEYVLRESTVSRLASGGTQQGASSSAADSMALTRHIDDVLERRLPKVVGRAVADALTLSPRLRLA